MQADIVPKAEAMSHRDACLALFRQAEENDAAAIQLVEEVGRYVGYGCVTIINAFNPQRIVLGDIVAHAGERLLQTVNKVVDARVIPELRGTTTITLSALPTDAAVLGAAAVAIDQVLERPSNFLEHP